jgi:hypothetical protein
MDGFVSLKAPTEEALNSIKRTLSLALNIIEHPFCFGSKNFKRPRRRRSVVTEKLEIF